MDVDVVRIAWEVTKNVRVSVEGPVPATSRQAEKPGSSSAGQIPGCDIRGDKGSEREMQMLAQVQDCYSPDSIQNETKKLNVWLACTHRGSGPGDHRHLGAPLGHLVKNDIKTSFILITEFGPPPFHFMPPRSPTGVCNSLRMSSQPTDHDGVTHTGTRSSST